MTRNKVLVLVSLSLWCLMLIIGASCRTSAPVAPRTELAAAPGSCGAVAFPTIDPTLSVPPMDIKGGAAAATLQDAAVFAWQEFIALNWPALPQTGAYMTRDQPDKTVPFGTTTGPLVWHTFRHKVEIFPGMGQPHGYPKGNASTDYGYDDLPQYIYTANATPDPTDGMPWIIPTTGQIPSFSSLNTPPSTTTPTPTWSPSPTPWINLDEQSEIGLDTMFAGNGPTSPFPGQQMLFLAKANRAEYVYVAANGWWTQVTDNNGNVTSPPLFQTANYIKSFANNPSAYVEPTPGSNTYVALPNNAIEVKSAWRQLTPAEASSGRFYTTTVRFYNANGSQQVGYIDAVWGLVALHIIQKTPSAPYFIYATFSQADNLLDATGNCIEDVNGNLVTGPCTSPSAATPAPTAPLEPNITSTPATSATPETPQTVQQLSPKESSLTVPGVGKRLYYSNTGVTPPPPPFATTQGLVALNGREHIIPPCIIDVNTAAHAAIATYTKQNNNVWMYYKLINVQYQPYDKPAGTTYTGATGGPDPSTYYQANDVVETNFNLQVFSGQFQKSLPTPSPVPSGYQAPNINNLITDYNSDSTSPFYGKPFKNVYYNMPTIMPTPGSTPSPNSGKAANMGGCMGCHGNAQVGGADFSFILQGGPVAAPDVATGPTKVPSDIGKKKFLTLLRH